MGRGDNTTMRSKNSRLLPPSIVIATSYLVTADDERDISGSQTEGSRAYMVSRTVVGRTGGSYRWVVQGLEPVTPRVSSRSKEFAHVQVSLNVK